MAKYIDDLLARVTDLGLRDELQREIGGLTKRRKFGLVFEHHEPESVELPQFTIRKHSVVRLRAFATRGTKQVHDERLWHVTTLANKIDDAGITVRMATIIPKGHESDDLTVPVTELIAVAEFGTPVYPGLKHTGSAVHAQSTAADTKPSHVVIKGENFHALQALTFTHEAKVDCIYIDPPYNTGGDFTYNDKRVSKEDSFRHSKWLSFMHRRLELAKRLLKNTGVIIVAIDDNEHAHLKLLMDQIFGEQNFISNVVWQGGLKNDSRYISNGSDYMLIYAKSEQAIAESNTKWREPKPGIERALEAAARAWSDSNGNHTIATSLFRKWMGTAGKDLGPGVTRFNEIEASTGEAFNADRDLSWPGGGGPRYNVLHPVTGRPVTVPSGGWRLQKDRMSEEIAAGRVAFGEDESKIPRGKRYLREMGAQVARSVFECQRTQASQSLAKTLGEKRFDFPKDTDVLARWIGLVTSQDSNAVILDFFGGSGSTLHAVMEMNAADNGSRQCFLVTNNEVETKQAATLTKAGHVPGDAEWESWGVLERVTRPRVSTVVTGIRAHLDASTYSAGLPDERVEFFDLTHEDPGAIRLARAYKAIEPLLWLRAGAVGAYMFTNGGTDNPVAISSPYAVLHDVNFSADFIQQVNADPTITHPFVVSESSATFQAIVRSLSEDRRDNAMRLYKGYTKTFETNTNQNTREN